MFCLATGKWTTQNINTDDIVEAVLSEIKYATSRRHKLMTTLSVHLENEGPLTIIKPLD